MDSFRFRSYSRRSTSFETDHHHHSLGLSIPRISRKYQSLSIDSGLGLIVTLSDNQTFESPTRLVMASSVPNSDRKIVTGPAGYVLEDVPHFTDYFPDYPTYPNPLQENAAYSVVKQYFVDDDDTVPQKIVVHPDSPRGIHFRRAGPRQKIYFESDDVLACIVTCGGLCPGINTVIREIVCGLSYMYGVKRILGIDGGYKGFYARNTIHLDIKTVNDIHRSGGTILGTSRGGHNTTKIVDSIQDRGINQVYIIGGDGSQKGAAAIFEEIRRRGLKVAVAGIPKTIDNDIPVAGQDLLSESTVESTTLKDASGNTLLQDIGLWISQRIKDHFAKKMTLNLKYIDPTYMIRAVPSNAADNVCCTLLAQSAVHGVMAGYNGFTVGLVNGRHTYIPFYMSLSVSKFPNF